MKKIWLFAVIFCLVSLTVAAGSKSQNEKKDTEVSLSGLLINQTLTPQGRRFYKTFSKEWRLLTPRDEFNIILKELPDPARSSQIKIIWNRQTLYNTFLGPARNKMLQKAKSAASIVNDRLQYIKIMQSLQTNPDLAEDEL
ncbi:curli production assembly/transport protein CsgE [Endozoicomonas sp. YOMI1]|uniref:curli production assembly/transport protein CsgE n=1 Tax=Endozoicomonas sp. YOMI1 TaxID=2828739 RepID=UPI00214994B7|nr:curli production assembly/transport protein CsgE [Endozoicomonas sp. YOMI1]